MEQNPVRLQTNRQTEKKENTIEYICSYIVWEEEEDHGNLDTKQRMKMSPVRLRPTERQIKENKTV